jgi:hypothetical protein
MTRIFGEAWAAGPPCRPLIAGCYRLTGLTGSLFVENRRRSALNMALDRLNLKYGSGTVYPASMIGAVEAAPMSDWVQVDSGFRSAVDGFLGKTLAVERSGSGRGRRRAVAVCAA